MWDTISQIGIATLGIAAVLLVAKKNKWGFVVGFLSQPFWLITSFINKQWGIFILQLAGERKRQLAQKIYAID